MGVCGGGYAWWGARSRGGRAWQEKRQLQRAVRILLECILVLHIIYCRGITFDTPITIKAEPSDRPAVRQIAICLIFMSTLYKVSQEPSRQQLTNDHQPVCMSRVSFLE